MSRRTSLSMLVLSCIASSLVLAILAPAPARAAQEPPNIATFSVAAYNPVTGEVGVAVQSKFFCVGSVVPWARAGVGAVASQAYGNPTYGPLGLDLMERGLTPGEALDVLTRRDPDGTRRQLGMVSVMDADGGSGGWAATMTGGECMAWAGGRTGKTADGIVYSVQGNILTGPEVVEAMAAALEPHALFNYTLNSGTAMLALGEATGRAPLSVNLTSNEYTALTVDDFAGRLLSALVAGEAAGGDSRGMQSAAMKVCQAGAGYGGYTDVKYDLRVDDAVNPFEELARLLNLARPFALTNEGYNLLYAGRHAEAKAIFSELVKLQPAEASHHYNLACALALSGELDAAMAELKYAVEGEELLRKSAAEDKDLTALRDRADFKALVGEPAS